MRRGTVRAGLRTANGRITKRTTPTAWWFTQPRSAGPGPRGPNLPRRHPDRTGTARAPPGRRRRRLAGSGLYQTAALGRTPRSTSPRRPPRQPARRDRSGHRSTARPVHRSQTSSRARPSTTTRSPLASRTFSASASTPAARTRIATSFYHAIRGGAVTVGSAGFDSAGGMAPAAIGQAVDGDLPAGMVPDDGGDPAVMGAASDGAAATTRFAVERTETSRNGPLRGVTVLSDQALEVQGIDRSRGSATSRWRPTTPASSTPPARRRRCTAPSSASGWGTPRAPTRCGPTRSTRGGPRVERRSGGAERRHAWDRRLGPSRASPARRPSPIPPRSASTARMRTDPPGRARQAAGSLSHGRTRTHDPDRQADRSAAPVLPALGLTLLCAGFTMDGLEYAL